MAALEKLAKICAQNPASILFARLADGLLQQGDVAQALAVCRTGSRYRPSYVAGHVVMGKCYLAAGQCEEARAAFEKVLQLDADHLAARWHLGHIALQQGRGDLALEHFESARARDPFGPELETEIAKLKGEWIEEARDDAPSDTLETHADAPGPVSEDAGFSQGPDLPPLAEGGIAIGSSVSGDHDAGPDLPPLAEGGIEEHLDALVLSRAQGPKPDAPIIATTTLAEIYAGQGLVQEAIAVLEQMAARDPDDAQVVARLDELRNLPE